MHRFVTSIAFVFIATLLVGLHATRACAQDVKVAPETTQSGESQQVNPVELIVVTDANKKQAGNPTVGNSSTVDRILVNKWKDTEQSESFKTRAELIRRIYLDLTGTPPTAEQMKKYQATPAHQIVARVLACPIANKHNGLWVAGLNAQGEELLPAMPLFSHRLNANAKCTQCHTTHTHNIDQAINRGISFLNATAGGADSVWSDWVVEMKSSDKPWIGIAVGPVDDVLKAQLNINTGVVVTKVAPDSPAQKAGVTLHDIVLSINGQAINSGEDVDKAVQTGGEDDPGLQVKLIQAGKITLRTIKAQQPIENEIDKLLTQAGIVRYKIGVRINNTDETLRTHLGLEENQGVVITEVIEGTPAAKAGVKHLDVITVVNDKPVMGTENLIAIVQDSQGNPLNIQLRRGGGQELKLLIAPEKEVDEQLKQRILNELAQRKRVRYEYQLLHPGFIEGKQGNALKLKAYDHIDVADATVRWVKPLKTGDRSNITTLQAETLKVFGQSDHAQVNQKLDQISKQLAELSQAVKALQDQKDAALKSRRTGGGGTGNPSGASD